MTDIDTLRRHERALIGLLESDVLYEHDAPALTWARDRCRAEIAKAERPDCDACDGTGWEGCYERCTGGCKGTGKKP